MDNSLQYEDFLPKVRQSLYGTNKLDKSPRLNTKKQAKKVKFNTNSNGINHQKPHSLKLKTRKVTPYKRKLNKHNIESLFDVRSEDNCVPGAYVRVRQPTKRKVVISFSSSDESFEKEDDDFSPSKSEMETFNTSFRNSNGKVTCIQTTSSTDQTDDSSTNFDLNAFFNSHEVSGPSEPITETHSGIDYEFVSDYANDVDIRSEAINDIDQSEESGSDVDDNITEINTEDEADINSITDEIQSVVIDDDVNQRNEHEEVVEKKAGSPAVYYNFEKRKVVVLKQNQAISFHGLFQLKVLHGKVEVLGCILDRNSNVAKLYSSKGAAFLCIKNVSDAKGSEPIEINRLVPNRRISETGDVIFVEASSAVFLCTKLQEPKIQFLEKHIPQKLFPRTSKTKHVQVIFEPSENVNILKENVMWDKVVTKVNSTTKLMIAGGKGVGKSTLLRFTINRLLNKYDKVRVVDLDPGQSEFTVPGCVSVVTVTEPVFGPSFTHLKRSDRFLLSNINVANQPLAYIKCVKLLSYYLETLEDCPTVINYMGFTQGMGMDLIASAIKYIRPTNVIQIQSRNRSRNFFVDLTYEIVEECSKRFSFDNDTGVGVGLNYELCKIPAMNDENDGWVMEPRTSRDMSILAYFGQMMGDGVNSLTSSDLPMYEIQLSEVKITDPQGGEMGLAVANGRMVALCSLEQEANIFVCLGHGLVRGIDVACNNLVLLTPEPAAVLEKVYYLVVIGNLALPPSIYMTPDGVTGTICYVNEGDLESLAQITRRSYLPANKY